MEGEKKDKKDKPDKPFLVRIRAWPEPVRKLLLWTVTAVLAGLGFFLILKRMKGNAVRVRNLEKEDIFHEPGRVEEIEKGKEQIKLELDRIKGAKELIKKLEQMEENVSPEEEEKILRQLEEAEEE